MEWYFALDWTLQFILYVMYHGFVGGLAAILWIGRGYDGRSFGLGHCIWSLAFPAFTAMRLVEMASWFTQDSRHRRKLEDKRRSREFDEELEAVLDSRIMSNTVDKDRPTVSVVNIVGLEIMAQGFWNKRTTDIYRAADESNGIVEAHKEVFGRQSYCINGSDRRYWVWERDGYRVFTANGYGIQMEVEPGTDPDTTEQMMRDYLDIWEPYLDEHLEVRYDEWIQREMNK